MKKTKLYISPYQLEKAEKLMTARYKMDKSLVYYYHLTSKLDRALKKLGVNNEAEEKIVF